MWCFTVWVSRHISYLHGFNFLLKEFNLFLPFLFYQRDSLSYLIVFKICTNKIPTKPSIFFNRKLNNFLTLFVSIEWCFKSIHWRFGEHLVQNYSSRILFILRNRKCWLKERDLFHLFATIVRKKLWVLSLKLKNSLFFHRITIKKRIKGRTMSMKINNKLDLSHSISCIQIFFNRINLRMKILSWLLPYSVQIITWKISSIISIKYTININHR